MQRKPETPCNLRGSKKQHSTRSSQPHSNRNASRKVASRSPTRMTRSWHATSPLVQDTPFLADKFCFEAVSVSVSTNQSAGEQTAGRIRSCKLKPEPHTPSDVMPEAIQVSCESGCVTKYRVNVCQRTSCVLSGNCGGRRYSTAGDRHKFRTCPGS